MNKFCLNAALNQDITVYKTALNQYRPYLSLRDAFKVFKFCIEKNFFRNDIFNILSGNFTVNQILAKIKNKKKTIKVKLVNSEIMCSVLATVRIPKLKLQTLRFLFSVITSRTHC